MFGSFRPGLGWLAPPKPIRAREPTLLWNQLHSSTRRHNVNHQPTHLSRAAARRASDSRRVPFTLTLYQTVLDRFDIYTIEAKIGRTPQDPTVGRKPQKTLARGDNQIIMTP